MRKGGHPKWSREPDVEKRVKIPSNPESSDKHTIAWQFHRRDHDHGTWGWNQLDDGQFLRLVNEHLSSFETMTWAELAKAAGGRRAGNNHHFIAVADCCKDAQKRLTELKLDDFDELFSLRLTGKWRLFGIRDGRVLRLIWCDQDHTVCPPTN